MVTGLKSAAFLRSCLIKLLIIKQSNITNKTRVPKDRENTQAVSDDDVAVVAND